MKLKELNLRDIPESLRQLKPKSESKLARPDFLIKSVTNLTYEALKREIPDIEAVVVDGDRTVFGQHATEFDPKMIDTLRREVGARGLKLIMQSNVYGEEAENRIEWLHSLLLNEGGNANEPLFTEVVTPDTLLEDRRVHLSAMREPGCDLDALRCLHEGGKNPSTAAYIWAFLMGREPHINAKPNPAMLEHILEEYSLEPEQVLVIGDQRRADIEVAKRLGAYSCLVSPYGEGDHLLVKWFVRPPEARQNRRDWGGSFPDELMRTETWAAHNGLKLAAESRAA